jgi:N-acylneuraminate cytidylyltransferase
LNQKIKTLLRSDENATDTASTESVMLEFATVLNHDFDSVCQATSPMTTSLTSWFWIKSKESFDSALTVVKTHRFSWNANGSPQIMMF